MNPQIPSTNPASAHTPCPTPAPLACPDLALPQPPPAILDAPGPTAQALACLDQSSALPAAIDATHLPVLDSSRKSRRNGRVACLPRRERDMVNRMIWNSVPYKNIIAALTETGFGGISERNISNWASGGYLEWSLTQEQALQNRLQQDHLLDFLRRDDAPDLPEVGLQAAATRLSQVLLQKLARADDPESHFDGYSKLVDLLCRLNREIAATQKQRDDSRRTLGRHVDPVRIREFEERETIKTENFYSDPPSDSKLTPAPVEPFLLPEPVSELLAQQDQERSDSNRELAFAMIGVRKPSAPPSASPKQLQPPEQPSPTAPVTHGSPAVGGGNPR